MNNSLILLFWAIAVTIICVSGTAFVYKKYKKTKRNIQENIDLAEKELLQDFDDIRLTELMQTKAGSELLALLVKENPGFNLLASQKTLSEILTKAKFKKTAPIEQAQFTGIRSTLSIPLSENEEQILKEKSKEKNNLTEAQMEQKVAEQLVEIQAKKIELVNKMNKAQMAMLEQKINMLGSAFDVVSKEHKSKLSQEFQKQLEELRENARTLSPKDLSEKTENLIGGMNFLLEGLPETLGELKGQLLKAAIDLEQQTNLLVASDDKAEKEEPPKE